MEQNTMAVTRPRGAGRAVAVLAMVLLTTLAFVGGSASPASAAICWHPALGAWGRDSGAITDVVVTTEIVSGRCTPHLEVWGVCDDSRNEVNWQDACLWGRNAAPDNTTWFGDWKVRVSLNQAGEFWVFLTYPGGGGRNSRLTRL